MSTENQIKELNEELKKTATSLQALAEERTTEKEKYGTFMGDTQETLKKMNVDLDEKTKQVEELQKTLVKIQEPGDAAQPKEQVEELQKMAFVTAMRYGRSDIHPVATYGKYNGEELVKALIVSDDTKGGILAPTEMESGILRDMEEISDFRKYANVKSTARKSNTVATRSGTARAKWDDELEESEENEDIKYGSLELPNHTLTAEVSITTDDLEDTEQDIEADIREAVSEQFAISEELGFVVGNATTKPWGFMSDDRILAENNGHATNLNADQILKLPKLTKNIYRKRGIYIAHSLTIHALRIMKDSTGNYIWKQGIAGGTPNTIDNKPYIEMDDMPGIVANSCPFIFGDFSGYKIRDRKNTTFFRDPYTLAKKRMVIIRAWKRVGGMVMEPYKFAKLRMAV